MSKLLKFDKIKSLIICCISNFDWLKQIVQPIKKPIKKPVRTLSIFMSMAFVKDAKGISFKNILKGHVNWRKVRNFNVIYLNGWKYLASQNDSFTHVKVCTQMGSGQPRPTGVRLRIFTQFCFGSCTIPQQFGGLH